jgi:hypothetical protein
VAITDVRDGNSTGVSDGRLVRAVFLLHRRRTARPGARDEQRVRAVFLHH